MFAELHCLTNFSFQRGASRAEELVNRARELGYSALAITDECSMAGMVKAHVAARDAGFKLIVGAEFRLDTNDGQAHVVLLAPNKDAYSEICNLITRGRRRADKGSYELQLDDLYHCRNHCLCLWLPTDAHKDQLELIKPWFKSRLWIGVELLQENDDQQHYFYCHDLAEQFQLPMVACNDVHMHSPKRKPLQDVLTAISHNTTVAALGRKRQRNAQRHLRSLKRLKAIYPSALLAETQVIADKCSFNMGELKYHYPREVVPEGMVPIVHLRQLVSEGEKRRWPGGTPQKIMDMLQKELDLIQKLEYEHYFLTVHVFSTSPD